MMMIAQETTEPMRASVTRLFVQYSMNKGHRDRALADGRCDSFDVTATHIAYGKHAWQAGFEQIRRASKRPLEA